VIGVGAAEGCDLLILRQADRAMINPVSLAASNRIATNFDVGV
jgi:hypothetical protein